MVYRIANDHYVFFLAFIVIFYVGYRLGKFVQRGKIDPSLYPTKESTHTTKRSKDVKFGIALFICACVLLNVVIAIASFVYYITNFV